MQTLQFIRKIACARSRRRAVTASGRRGHVSLGASAADVASPSGRRRRAAARQRAGAGARAHRRRRRLAGGSGPGPDGADGEAAWRWPSSSRAPTPAAPPPPTSASASPRRRAPTASGRPMAAAPETRLCLGGPKAHTRAGLVTVDAAERPLTRGAVRVKVKRPSAGQDRALGRRRADPPDRPAPRPPRLARARERRRLRSPPALRGRLSADRRQPLPLRPVRAVGCTGGERRTGHRRAHRTQGRRPHLRRRPERIHRTLPRPCCAKRKSGRPSSRSARRCPAGRRRCAGSSPKATSSATTR